jgi:hypothetical protein
MKAVAFDEIGLPTQVLRLVAVEIRDIGEDDVLVKMLASPINPGIFSLSRLCIQSRRSRTSPCKLLKGVAIKSHIYRYLFRPPRNDDLSVLRRITELSRPDEFRMPLGGLHSEDDFGAAITESFDRPEKGKRLFKM